jgi:hypothetical protein
MTFWYTLHDGLSEELLYVWLQECMSSLQTDDTRKKQISQVSSAIQNVTNQETNFFN